MLDNKSPLTTRPPLLPLEETRPFEEYSEDERIELARGLRTKRPEDLTDEEKRYEKWLNSLGGGENDSQPSYRR